MSSVILIHYLKIPQLIVSSKLPTIGPALNPLALGGAEPGIVIQTTMAIVIF